MIWVLLCFSVYPNFPLEARKRIKITKNLKLSLLLVFPTFSSMADQTGKGAQRRGKANFTPAAVLTQLQGKMEGFFFPLKPKKNEIIKRNLV